MSASPMSDSGMSTASSAAKLKLREEISCPEVEGFGLEEAVAGCKGGAVKTFSSSSDPKLPNCRSSRDGLFVPDIFQTGRFVFGPKFPNSQSLCQNLFLK